jgi:teichoic acid transport system permease protein
MSVRRTDQAPPDGAVDDELRHEDSDPDALGAAPTLSADTRRRDKRAGRRDGDRGTDAPPALDLATGDHAGVTHVFEPHSAALPPLRPYLNSLWERRRFMAALARANIRGRHSSTALGSLWSVMDPLFQAAIYLFLFMVIRGNSSRPQEFVPVLMAGVFLLRLTTSTISEGGKSIRSSRDLMLSSAFPRAILPLAAVYKGVINFVPTIFVFVPVYIIFGVPPHKSLLLLPLLFAIQIVTNIGAALLVSTIAVFIKDTENALTYLVRVLFFVTPVIYPVGLLPDEVKAFLQFLPLYPLFVTYQYVIGGNNIDSVLIVGACAWAVGLLMLGGWLFLRYEQAMASRL